MENEKVIVSEGEEEITRSEAKYYADKRIIETITPSKWERLPRGERDGTGVLHENWLRYQKEQETIEENKELEEAELILPEMRELYEEIKAILKTFMDMKEEYYTLIAIWILGTYCYKEFECYPLLFVNATKGSGKTRLMKLLEHLVWNGKLQLNISESVMFRTKKNNTILLDELEQIGTKEQGTIREMMNASYKRGNRVTRMERKQTKEGDKYEPVEFDLYSPMAMANIWGMDETVLDRCVQVLLEKSNDKSRTQFLENYTNYTPLKHANSRLRSLECSWCSWCSKKNNIEKWNDFILQKYKITAHPTVCADTTLSTLSTLSTLNNNNNIIINKEEKALFDKIEAVGLQGRDLELYFPLFIISSALSEATLEEMLRIAKELVKEKDEEEFSDNPDIALCDFVSKKKDMLQYVKVTDLVSDFRVNLGGDDVDWLNSRWMTNSLRRLGLITSKRRMAGGVQVLLNPSKALERLKKYERLDK